MPSRALRRLDVRMTGWHGLGAFWGVLLVAASIGAGVLQYLGPVPHAVAPIPPNRPKSADAPAQAKHPEAATAHDPIPPISDHAAEPAHTATAEAPAPTPPPTPRVSPPDPALLEKSALFPPALLPRVAADGRTARTVYAAPMPPAAAGIPRVALLLAGFGLSERDSRAALDQLPGPVSFAVSAYATVPGLLEVARAAGHELLASIPMEPQGYPLNDEGAKSLRTGLSLEDNRKNLEWALSRTQGTVGATGASDGMKGERFADVTGVFDPALEEIGRRGLLYIDPRPGRAIARPGLPSRSIDVVLDESLARAEIEGKLLALERVARERGSAMGLAGPLRPVTVERIAAWIGTLRERGLVLVPVSSLVEYKS